MAAMPRASIHPASSTTRRQIASPDRAPSRDCPGRPRTSGGGHPGILVRRGIGSPAAPRRGVPKAGPAASASRHPGFPHPHGAPSGFTRDDRSPRTSGLRRSTPGVYRSAYARAICIQKKAVHVSPAPEARFRPRRQAFTSFFRKDGQPQGFAVPFPRRGRPSPGRGGTEEGPGFTVDDAGQGHSEASTGPVEERTFGKIEHGAIPPAGLSRGVPAVCRERTVPRASTTPTAVFVPPKSIARTRSIMPHILP
jgi:hypothetical protein